jgi:hypothetical protein
VAPIGSLTKPGRATVEGRVRAVEIRPVEQNSVLAAEIADSTGELTALFYGRSRIPGLICGARVRFRGTVGIRAGLPFMVNPTYELLAIGPSGPDEQGQSGGSGSGGSGTGGSGTGGSGAGGSGSGDSGSGDSGSGDSGRDA